MMSHNEVPAATALDSLAVGAQGAPFAEGYGISEPVPATADTRLTLTPPGTLRVIAVGQPSQSRTLAIRSNRRVWLVAARIRAA